MGKGSNVQKAQQARERNAKKLGKSEEERKAASAKAKADASAFMCLLCRQTFMVNAKPPVLLQHVTAKHPGDVDPASCFPMLKDLNSNEPKNEAKSEAPKPKKAAKKKDADLDDLLNAGLAGGKKKKK